MTVAQSKVIARERFLLLWNFFQSPVFLNFKMASVNLSICVMADLLGLLVPLLIMDLVFSKAQCSFPVAQSPS